MTFQQFLLILRARSRLVLFTLTTTVLVTLAVSLLLPKQYTANTAVVIDVKSPDPIAGLVLPGLISPSYMATQVDIINSDRVAQRVVKLLRMDEDPATREKWQSATEGKGELTVWLAERLQKKLDVKPSRESNVINITVNGPDPESAARIANAFAEAFIDVNIDLRVEPARQNAVWFEGQTRLVRAKLDAAQQALSSYQQDTGVVATSDDHIDFETAKLNELSTQLTVVQGQTSDSHSKSTIPGGSETSPEVMQNMLIINLKTNVALLESKLQESNINLGQNHPQTQRTESELASLKARLASETAKIVSSFNAAYQVGRQKEKELLAAIETQKTRVLSLNKQRDEYNVLKRDVEAAQRDFESVGLRSAQTRLESLSVQTNAVVLTSAAVPTDASKPKVILNLLMSVLLGGMLGVGFALMLELGNRRVRSAEDLTRLIDLPLLASIGSTASPQRVSKARKPILLPAA